MNIYSNYFLLMLALLNPAETATFQETFDLWAQDLKPGYMITVMESGNQRCHCKVPSSSSSSSLNEPESPSRSSFDESSSTIPSSSVFSSSKTSSSYLSSSIPHSSSFWWSSSLKFSSLLSSSTFSSTQSSPFLSSSLYLSSSIFSSYLSTTTTLPPSTTVSTTINIGTTTTTAKLTQPTTDKTTTEGPKTTTVPATATSTPVANVLTSLPSTTTSYTGDCNLTYTFDKAGGTHSINWGSPNYPEDYPDGIRCILTIHIAADISIGYLSVNNVGPANIFTSANCQYDKLIYTAFPGALPIKYCGDLSQQSWDTNQLFDGPHTVEFEFISDPADGNSVDLGFMLDISMFVTH